MSGECEIGIRDSDDPHGIFSVSRTSQRIDGKEGDQVEVRVDRSRGTIGVVRVHFALLPGPLVTLNPDVGVAQPGDDFMLVTSPPLRHIDFDDGVTSSTIALLMIDDDIPELSEVFHLNLTRVELLMTTSSGNGSDYDVITDPHLPPLIGNLQ